LSNNKNNIKSNDIRVGGRIRPIHTDDIHTYVREGDTSTILELTTVPKGSHSNELDLIIRIEWDNVKSRTALTEGIDQ
jgi:hypothetical protein